MTAVASYFRTTPSQETKAAIAEAERSLRSYVRAKLPGVELVGVFRDDAAARRLRFDQRPGATAAQRSLDRGGHLVIGSVAAAFVGWRDFLTCMRVWSGMGLHVHLPEFGGDTTTEAGTAALALLVKVAEADGRRRSEWASTANARRRRSGRPANGSAPYGYFYTGKRGSRRLMRDRKTRQIGALIVKWKLDGYSWSEIYNHLAAQHVLTRRGTEWSVGSIQRAFRGECLLQAQEADEETRAAGAAGAAR